MANKCKGMTFPKETPYFVMGKSDVIKKSGMERFGKIPVGNTTMFAVEDQFTITRYNDKRCALKHFNNNIKINREIRKLRR